MFNLKAEELGRLAPIAQEAFSRMLACYQLEFFKAHNEAGEMPNDTDFAIGLALAVGMLNETTCKRIEDLFGTQCFPGMITNFAAETMDAVAPEIITPPANT